MKIDGDKDTKSTEIKGVKVLFGTNVVGITGTISACAALLTDPTLLSTPNIGSLIFSLVAYSSCATLGKNVVGKVGTYIGEHIGGLTGHIIDKHNPTLLNEKTHSEVIGRLGGWAIGTPAAITGAVLGFMFARQEITEYTFIKKIKQEILNTPEEPTPSFHEPNEVYTRNELPNKTIHFNDALTL